MRNILFAVLYLVFAMMASFIASKISAEAVILVLFLSMKVLVLVAWVIITHEVSKHG